MLIYTIQRKVNLFKLLLKFRAFGDKSRNILAIAARQALRDVKNNITCI